MTDGQRGTIARICRRPAPGHGPRVDIKPGARAAARLPAGGGTEKGPIDLHRESIVYSL